MFVDLLNNCFCRARIIHQQNRVYFWPLILFHQSEDNGILDQWLRTQHVFDILRIHFHAVGEHDQVLLAPLQIEIVPSIQITKVAGMIPTILKDRGSGLGVLPVS